MKIRLPQTSANCVSLAVISGALAKRQLVSLRSNAVAYRITMRPTAASRNEQLVDRFNTQGSIGAPAHPNTAKSRQLRFRVTWFRFKVLLVCMISEYVD